MVENNPTQFDGLLSKLNELPSHLRHFSGSDYVPVHDQARLTGQIERVFTIMKDGKFRTLTEIYHDIFKLFQKHDSEASISAQLRNLRKVQFGSYTINKQPRGDRGSGLWEYQLTIPC